MKTAVGAAIRALAENISDEMVEAAEGKWHREWDYRMAVTAALLAALTEDKTHG